MTRGTGETKAVVMALPDEGACVIVHNASMVRYVERMILDLRGRDTMKRCRIICVQSQRDADRLHGLGMRTYVDHAFWELTRDIVLMRRVDALVDAINLQFPPNNLDEETSKND
jgi:3-deoxy-D-manno-octulosonic-acid transferase